VRLAFDSRAVTDPRGIGRYVRCLLEALHETAADNTIVETHRPRQADIYHSPWVDGAMVHTPCPLVVTLHNLVALRRRSEHLRTGLRSQLRYLAIQRAAQVIVPTATVRADAHELLGVDHARITVIPEAAARTLHRRPEAEVAATRGRHGLPEEYLLWVGGLQHPDPRKRLAELVAAPRELPLVLVGATRRWAHELPGVLVTGHVSDEDLACIYTGAHALICASDDAGFGLTTVEALSCGTPVVACEAPALREVLGDRATFVAADDFAGLMAAAAGARRPAPPPPPWTWTDAARATWAIYEAAAATAAEQTVTQPGRSRGPRRSTAGPGGP
jgi:glycosyltransferase involved in cell wall biosynthesis